MLENSFGLMHQTFTWFCCPAFPVYIFEVKVPQQAFLCVFLFIISIKFERMIVLIILTPTILVKINETKFKE